MEHTQKSTHETQDINKEKDIFGRIRNTVGTAVLVGTAIVGGHIVTAENAMAETEEIEFKESYEMQFQRTLIQNEILFNQELAKRNIPLVKFGQPKMTFRCGTVQIGIYSETGEHLMDSSCTFKQFMNRYEFIDYAKKRIIPILAEKYSVTSTESSEITKAPRLSPEKLLKMARFDYSAINFFGKHDLTLSARIVPNKDGSQGTAYICIERKKDSRLGEFREDVCYDDSTLQADFTYSQKYDVVHIEVVNQDGSKQVADLHSEYTRDGRLSGFR